MLYSKSYIKGPAHDWVVFIHGAGGSSSIWFRQLRDFRKHFNVLLVDLRGHGRSQPFIQSFYENKYTFEAVSRALYVGFTIKHKQGLPFHLSRIRK